MTPREANVLLTQAALLDARLRCEPDERAQMATAWALVLAEVPLQSALEALAMHYREQTRSVMPADLVALTEDMLTPDRVGLADGREWLGARGIDPQVFQARLDAGERPSRVLQELGAEVRS